MNKKMKDMYNSFDATAIFDTVQAIELLKGFTSVRKGSQSFNVDIALKQKKNQDLPNNYIFTIPHGLTRAARILVVTSNLEGEKLKRDNKYSDPNGSCFVKIGSIDDVRTIISAGKTDFNYIVTRKEDMVSIAPFARDLVALKLMPSVKNGTVADDIMSCIHGIVSGNNITAKKNNNHIRFKFASVTDSTQNVKENVEAIASGLVSILKSIDSIGFIKLATTRGPSVNLNVPKLCGFNSR